MNKKIMIAAAFAVLLLGVGGAVAAANPFGAPAPRVPPSSPISPAMDRTCPGSSMCPSPVTHRTVQENKA
jgi:hypothetical protein